MVNVNTFCCRYSSSVSLELQGQIYVGAGGGEHVPPDSLVAPPQIQKLADRSDVIFQVPKCSKMQIFRGSAHDPAKGAYSISQTPS